MLLLAIETSTPRSSVALVDQDGVQASATLGVAQRHGEFLAPAIRFCLTQAGLGTDDIAGVVVGTGPGLFTGLRVGIATAQAFAAARSLPALGISGLDVLAYRARHTHRLITTVVDARRGEVFWASYRAVPGGVTLVEEAQVTTPDALSGELQGRDGETLLVGDGARRYADVLDLDRVELAGPEFGAPEAGDLGALAVPRFIREETVRPVELQPVYLRQADAKIGWETRGKMRGGVA